MENLFTLIFGVFLLCTFTPVPAIVCFRAAWGPDVERDSPLARRLLLAIPTTVFPVVLLALHAVRSVPEWKEYGDEYFYYMAKGSASRIYFPPFAAANLLVLRTILDRDYARSTLLPLISLVTCILTCAFFSVGNLNVGLLWIFPLSAACAYAYGLNLLIRSGDTLVIMAGHLLLVGVWLIMAIFTILASIARTKELVAELPDESPDCFIVTAAAKGHCFVVHSAVDEATGRLANDQLKTFRSFEAWLIKHFRGTHKTSRSIYNLLASTVARAIVFRWQADLVYFILKPIEWSIRFARLN